MPYPHTQLNKTRHQVNLSLDSYGFKSGIMYARVHRSEGWGGKYPEMASLPSLPAALSKISRGRYVRK